MGESQKQAFQLSFNRFLRVTFQGSRITSDGGLILVRELDERLGFGELIEQHLIDSRGKNTRLPLADLLRQSIYSRLAGYEDVNDAERLSQDPTFRLIGSEKIWERGAALTSPVTVVRDRTADARREPCWFGSDQPGFDRQGGSYGCRRAGWCWTWTAPRSRSTANRSRAPTTGISSRVAITRCCCSVARVTVWRPSCDPATCTAPRIGKNFSCQRSNGSRSWARKWCFAPTPPSPSRRSTTHWRSGDVKYAIRIPANDSLERDIAELLTRPVGRPSHKPVVWYKSFLYQAASWKKARRVVAKVEFHFGELFPRVGFIVTNLETDSRAVVRFYNKRGTAEQWIKEGKQAVKMTRLSCHRFRSNEVRLWLSLIAYNLGNLWRRLVLPKRINNWSLTSLQQRLVKTGGRLVKHARYYWLLLAEGHLSRRLFSSMLRTISALPLPDG